jgi:hypothetical protein
MSPEMWGPENKKDGMILKRDPKITLIWQAKITNELVGGTAEPAGVTNCEFLCNLCCHIAAIVMIPQNWGHIHNVHSHKFLW